MTTTRLAAATPHGTFTIRPLVEGGDLDLLHAWMNDPAVARFWQLDGPVSRLEQHLEQQRRGGHSRLCVGLLEGAPMSYWEFYTAGQDRIADYYPAQPADMGLHLLIGPAHLRGVGLGWRLLAAVSSWLLDGPYTQRVLAEPDVRNSASIRAFERAGFVRARTIELPEKTAVLMTREPYTTAFGDIACSTPRH